MPGAIEQVLEMGANAVRINFSHGDEDEYLERVHRVRRWAKENNTYISVLMDLQGPKIRIAGFNKRDGIVLASGKEFTLDANLGRESGDEHSVGIAYKELPNEVRAGSVLILDDGRIILEIVRIDGLKIITKVIQGGALTDRKGINLRGGGLSAKALTDKDKLDILIAVKANADYVALSFPISGDDVRETKRLLLEAGSTAGVVAKIERAEALEENVLNDIMSESAGIMVARGDLGVEIGDPLLPAEQKRLIKKARAADKFVITATQMLESMINSPIATRAEVFDIANAVLDGTDMVMLSAETATGKYPVGAVRTMHEVCMEAEKNPIANTSHHRLHECFMNIDETIAMSAMYAANHLGVKVIATLTETGKTALWMSRISSTVSIYAMSDCVATLRKVTMYKGVYPCGISKSTDSDWQDVNKAVINQLVKKKAVLDGDLVILTKGMHRDKSGGTNMMKIIEIGSSEL